MVERAAMVPLPSEDHSVGEKMCIATLAFIGVVVAVITAYLVWETYGRTPFDVAIVLYAFMYPDNIRDMLLKTRQYITYAGIVCVSLVLVLIYIAILVNVLIKTNIIIVQHDPSCDEETMTCIKYFMFKGKSL